MGLPALLQALGRNASTSEGAASLAHALDQHQDDDVDDLDGFLNNVDREDGAKILQHIFADKNAGIQNRLAQKTGMETNQVMDIMEQLAPLLMGTLAQQKKQRNVDQSGIADLLGGMMQQGNGGKNSFMNMAMDLLDANNDGSIVDDIGGVLKGFLKQ
ncbi:hypothetical protein SDC9_210624 [bioreactor metagenome]|uniref:DUF937 domain-containing protein n=1 Tax=bioreactor metagenome TaxID=1076179 RepID=A0A645JGY4_9ZZZZ